MARPLFIRSAPPKRKCHTAKRQEVFAKYMQRPPTIMPNYKKSPDKLGVPKTSLSRVLLYDNITQQQMLDVKIANIRIERQRVEQLYDTHKRNFNKQVRKMKQIFGRRAERERREAKGESLSRFPSIVPTTRVQPTEPVLRRVSTLSLADLKLPQIDQHNKHIILKLQTKSGRRRLFHSYDENGIFVDAVPLYKFYPEITDDPRFQKLETTLIYPEEEQTPGYAVLSPSYVKNLPKIPEFLQEIDDVQKDE